MTQPTSRVRSVAAGAAVALLASAAVGSLAAPASAAPDKTVTASNTSPVAIPEEGFGNPLPTTILVPADRGVVTDVDVTLVGLDHTCVADLQVMLTSPNGVRATVIAEAGNCGANPAPLTLTFDDEAAGALPDVTPLPSGGYKPTDTMAADPDRAPASLAVFDGAPTSGTWSLYIIDTAGGDSGSLTGGWSLDIDYNDTVAPGGSVVIDGGAASTDSPTSKLTLNASDPSLSTGVAQMRFSHDGTTWSAFQAYAATTSWTLTPGDGTKTVWAQYADGIGNLSAPVSDTIVLDTTAPQAKKLTPKKNAKDVSVKSAVSFVASESLDAASVTKKTVKLTAGGKSVKAKVSYSAGKKKVTLKPSKPLAADTTYKVTLSKVADANGNAIKKTTWKFTTA